MGKGDLDLLLVLLLVLGAPEAAPKGQGDLRARTSETAVGGGFTHRYAAALVEDIGVALEACRGPGGLPHGSAMGLVEPG